MRLTSFVFNELAGHQGEWYLEDLSLSTVNLLVGKNATGKSRTLNAIHFLSTLLSGERREVVSSATCKAVFEQEHDKWEYTLQVENATVVQEELEYNGENVLHRGQGGLGRILAVDIEDRPVKIKFSIPGPQVAVFAKQDVIQHPFLTPLREWGDSVRLFRFGTEMGPHNLGLRVNVQVPVNEKDTKGFVPIYNKAATELHEPFVNALIADMKALGYDLTSVAIRSPSNLMTNVILPGELVGVSVGEGPLRCVVDQPSMSQGMFRALSLLAQTNYYAMTKKPVCILIDDIGDGLDFERSVELIDLLRKKVYDSGFQLAMSSNNRFVMNRVPLTEWCVLERKGHHVKVRNYTNSRAVFERFKKTGLNNFDLLTTDFLEKVNPDGTDYADKVKPNG